MKGSRLIKVRDGIVNVLEFENDELSQEDQDKAMLLARALIKIWDGLMQPYKPMQNFTVEHEVHLDGKKIAESISEKMRES